MYQLILVIHVFIAVALILLVLVQQGKGATMGAAFGSGASGTVFGSRGSGSFLLKITIGFVIIFFATSMTLNYISSRAVRATTPIVLPAVPTQEAPGAPVTTTVSPNSIPGDQTTQLPVGNVKK